MNRQRLLTSSAAFLTRSSSICPSMSTKNMYSQAFRREGRDSILVMFRPWEANGRNKSYRAPTLSLTDNISDVLSRPVRSGAFCDSTRKRVKLLMLSSILAVTTFSPYNWDASSDAMAAAEGSSTDISAARAVLATSDTGTCGKFVSNQLRHWAMACGCE